MGMDVLEKTSVYCAREPATSLGESIYYSLITFTTVGFGDICPSSGLARMLTGIEAVIGGITMALTVLVVAKKFMR